MSKANYNTHDYSGGFQIQSKPGYCNLVSPWGQESGWIVFEKAPAKYKVHSFPAENNWVTIVDDHENLIICCKNTGWLKEVCTPENALNNPSWHSFGDYLIVYCTEKVEIYSSHGHYLTIRNTIIHSGLTIEPDGSVEFTKTDGSKLFFSKKGELLTSSRYLT